MARFVFVGLANAVPGREQEYEDWYANEHLPSLMQCQGVKSVRRFKPASAQVVPATHSYQHLAIFEVEAEDPATFTNDLLSRAKSGQMPSSDATAPGSFAFLWEEVSSQ